MKPFRLKNKEIVYLGCIIRVEKEYIYVYDELHQCMGKIWNINHGSYTDAKIRIERHVHKYRPT